MSISLKKLTLLKRMCKTVSETRTDGREMLLARRGDASRHRVVRARGGRSRSCAPPNGRARWTGSGAILTASTTPLLFAHRSESCPPDGRDARARAATSLAASDTTTLSRPIDQRLSRHPLPSISSPLPITILLVAFLRTQSPASLSRGFTER